jgi:alpha-tubulin suppressor-like RCC1 family protein
VNGTLSTAFAIAAGGRHSCAIQDGTRDVICWGRNFDGEATPPDAVNGIAGTADAISAGYDHSCAIQAETGNVVCWGRDDSGEATAPPSVDGTLGTATAIAAGSVHTLAIAAPEPLADLVSAASLGSLVALAHRRQAAAG